MPVDVVLPLVKLLIITLVVVLIASVVVAAVCDFMNINRTIPLFAVMVVITLFLYSGLYRQMKELMDFIFA